MTHIIGKPPAPKGGATFEDVLPESLFLYKGTTMRRLADEVVDDDGCRRNARNCHTGGLATFYGGTSVTLLDITPRDPDPDPAVTTYGELEPGEWFHFLDTPFPALKSQRGYTRLDGVFYPVDSILGDMFVRRVAASVVLHEEPGTLRMRDLLNGKRGEPDAAVVHRCSCPGFCWVGTELYSREKAERLAGELAALLAQEPASPESGEPEPASTWYESEAQSERIQTTPFRSDREPSEEFQKAWGKAKPEPHPMAGTELTAHDTEPEELSVEPSYGVIMTEPAEDRSKPAPGWEVIHTEPDCSEYTAETRAGFEPIVEHSVAPWTEAEAIEWTWAQHDAQQAGKGGES